MALNAVPVIEADLTEFTPRQQAQLREILLAIKKNDDTVLAVYAGVGLFRLLPTVDLTGAAQTIALPGDTRFRKIIVELSHLRSVNNARQLWLRVDAGSGIDSTAAHYAWAEGVTDSAGIAGSGSASDSKIVLTKNAVDNTSTKGISGTLVFKDPGETAHHKQTLSDFEYWDTVTGDSNRVFGSGEFIFGTTALIGFQLSWDDASNFAEGLCDVFGLLSV